MSEVCSGEQTFVQLRTGFRKDDDHDGGYDDDGSDDEDEEDEMIIMERFLGSGGEQVTRFFLRPFNQDGYIP